MYMCGCVCAYKNNLKIQVSNLMANRIAYMDRKKIPWKKFYNINFPARKRENRDNSGLFNASSWVPVESGLIGPVNLIPSKRKSGNFNKGKLTK